MSDPLVEAIVNMQEEDALRIVQDMLARGEDAARVLELCQTAMEVVGQRYECGDYFLPELIMAGEMLKTISETVKPKLGGPAAERRRLGKIVLGTVRGDIHDIGKDIVGFMLDVNGFEVHDLGVDVPEERFVQAVKEVQPDVVALSGFLTLASETMKTTVDALQAAGLRDQVKVMIGGGQVNELVRSYAGADAFGNDAIAAVALAREWTGTKGEVAHDDR